jgi:hypothetical protein
MPWVLWPLKYRLQRKTQIEPTIYRQLLIINHPSFSSSTIIVSTEHISYFFIPIINQTIQ